MFWISGHSAEEQFPELCPEQNRSSPHVFSHFPYKVLRKASSSSPGAGSRELLCAEALGKPTGCANAADRYTSLFPANTSHQIHYLVNALAMLVCVPMYCYCVFYIIM